MIKQEELFAERYVADLDKSEKVANMYSDLLKNEMSKRQLSKLYHAIFATHHRKIEKEGVIRNELKIDLCDLFMMSTRKERSSVDVDLYGLSGAGFQFVNEPIRYMCRIRSHKPYDLKNKSYEEKPIDYSACLMRVEERLKIMRKGDPINKLFIEQALQNGSQAPNEDKKEGEKENELPKLSPWRFLCLRKKTKRDGKGNTVQQKYLYLFRDFESEEDIYKKHETVTKTKEQKEKDKLLEKKQK